MEKESVARLRSRGVPGPDNLRAQGVEKFCLGVAATAAADVLPRVPTLRDLPTLGPGPSRDLPPPGWRPSANDIATHTPDSTFIELLRPLLAGAFPFLF